MPFRSILKVPVGRLTSVRGLHAGQQLLKAQVFAMPAMSPTMEKGGIVEWKFKVGESFSAGDVLLEVETDKSQIDVEAQDDGKMAKIIVDNGAKDVNVGEVIAYLAEPEDDLASLELPSPDSSSKKEASSKKEENTNKKETAAEPAPKAVPSTKKPAASSSSGTRASEQANPSQVLLPSVQILLHENNISAEDAIQKIPASGPNGRILKGDVLSYVGKVSQDAASKLTQYIKKFEKLDLSNIELKAPEPKQAIKSEAPGPVKPQPVVLSEQLYLKTAQNVSLEQFAKSLRAYINEAKYLSHDQPVANSHSDHYDHLFEELITPEPTQPRFQVSYDLIPTSVRDLTPQQHDDIFDLLAGPSNLSTKVDTNLQVEQSNEYLVDLKVTVSDKFGDANIKAQRFVDYVRDLETSPEN
ncbi:LADA_0F10088g1_1 [Lachancea dasiensis]|uniref:Dihydrolipoamide dehydrogenase-binding protein of pyruvate dehydrogenase complex n=1 Tax=Lachancea dasiensis TaxID=1072105 RepID=A0A1G4JLL1_9SACH|nr:LADA_0F10088g1_1 [Lachancea dasiensis]